MRALAVIGVLLSLFLPAGVSATPPPADLEAVRLSVIEVVNADTANFGGIYVEDDGTLVIQYVGANAGRTAVDERLTPGVAVRWEKVDRSHGDLIRTLREIRAEKLDGVVMVAVDTIRNQVEVTVSPSERAAAVASAVQDRYGASAAVKPTDDPPVVVACTDRFSCTRWRGGIEIISAGVACTWGFQASRNGYLQMISAGHCAEDGQNSKHDGVTIGSVGENAIDPSTFGELDVLRTKVTGPDYPTTQNTLYATNQEKSWALTTVRNYSSMAVGQDAGKSARTTNFTYGEITNVFVEYQLFPGDGEPALVHYPNCTFNTRSTCPWVWGVRTNFLVAGGDSGGPVYSTINVNNPPMSTSLLGFVSAGSISGPVTLFAPASPASLVLDLDFWCTTAGCP